MMSSTPSANSPDAETARERLMSRFNLTEVQAQAILDMQLRRLAALERQKIEDEHKRILRAHCLPGRLAGQPAQRFCS